MELINETTLPSWMIVFQTILDRPVPAVSNTVCVCVCVCVVQLGIVLLTQHSCNLPMCIVYNMSFIVLPILLKAMSLIA